MTMLDEHEDLLERLRKFRFTPSCLDEEGDTDWQAIALCEIKEKVKAKRAEINQRLKAYEEGLRMAQWHYDMHKKNGWPHVIKEPMDTCVTCVQLETIIEALQGKEQP